MILFGIVAENRRGNDRTEEQGRDGEQGRAREEEEGISSFSAPHSGVLLFAFVSGRGGEETPSKALPSQRHVAPPTPVASNPSQPSLNYHIPACDPPHLLICGMDQPTSHATCAGCVGQ